MHAPPRRGPPKTSPRAPRIAAEPPRAYAYGDRPLREEIVRSVAGDGERAAVVTRNSFGCLVLNTAGVLFVDVDLPRAVERRTRRLARPVVRPWREAEESDEPAGEPRSRGSKRGCGATQATASASIARAAGFAIWRRAACSIRHRTRWPRCSASSAAIPCTCACAAPSRASARGSRRSPGGAGSRRRLHASLTRRPSGKRRFSNGSTATTPAASVMRSASRCRASETTSSAPTSRRSSEPARRSDALRAPGCHSRDSSARAEILLPSCPLRERLLGGERSPRRGDVATSSEPSRPAGLPAATASLTTFTL